MAVIENPFAGRFVEDLAELVKTGEELGDLLGRRAVAALGAPVHSYGKAAVVGEDGEYEHAAAILHPTLGTPFRAAVGGGKAIIPSAKKLGGPGTAIDVPLHYKDAAFVRTPLRRDGGAPGGRAEGERDPGGAGGHRRRPAASPRRRPDRATEAKKEDGAPMRLDDPQFGLRLPSFALGPRTASLPRWARTSAAPRTWASTAR